MLQAMVRAFARDEIAPLARAIDREERFPSESFARAGELGLLGIAAPEAYGGSDLGVMEMCIVGEEVAAVCVSTAATLLHQADMVVSRFVRHGTESQCLQFVPGLCDGTIIGCLAMTEPEAGSDVMSMRTRATRVDGGYVLNGTKTLITNAPVADVALVYARTGGDDGGGLSLFIVETARDGVTRGKKFTKMGWRGSPTGELVFDDCFVPTENLLGAEGDGRVIMFAGLNTERIVMAAECVGLSQGALDVALEYARQRRQFGQAIGEFQLVQGKLATMYAETEACRAMVTRAAQMVDRGRGEDVARLSAACKLFTADVAMRSTTEAVQILGGYGYIDEFPVERFMRDAKLMQIGGGTSEIQQYIIGRSLLKNGTGA